MTFQGDGPLDTDGVSGGGISGGVIAGGGGLLAVVGLVASMFLGFNPLSLLPGGGGGAATSNSPDEDLQKQIQSCTIQKANSDTVCRIVATKNSLDLVWPQLIGNRYTKPKVVIFASKQVNTNGCGAGSEDMGPFYCPADKTAYFAPSFFDRYLTQLGGSDGPLAQEYVIAHEYGHHVQNLLNPQRRSSNATGENSVSVNLELQADCLAGMWVSRADKGPNALLKPITQDQIATVITTANAIGDDALQKRAGRNPSPEQFSHGSSADRTTWFMNGYRANGDVNKCDTFKLRGTR